MPAEKLRITVISLSLFALLTGLILITFPAQTRSDLPAEPRASLALFEHESHSTRPEGFLALPFPDRSLFSFVFEELQPAFSELKKEKVILPAHISLDFFKRLTPAAKEIVERSLALRPGDTNRLKRLLSYVENGQIDLKSLNIELTPSHGTLPDSIQRTRLAILARMGLYDMGVGVQLSDPSFLHDILFIPISHHNLRSFTVIEGQYLEDKTYRQFCDVLRYLNNPAFFESWADIVLSGFGSLKSHGLSREEELLLYDGAAIYMAETYKYLTLNNPDMDHLKGDNLFNLVLLSAYLNNEGVFGVSESGQWDVRTGNCFYFFTKYRSRRAFRQTLERDVTEALQAHFPETIETLYINLPESTAFNDNLFARLANEVYEGRPLTEEAFQSIHELIAILTSQTSVISGFIQDKYKTSL